jgi:hypothetical protein
MSEYIIDDSKCRKTEITRCKDCVLGEKDTESPYLVRCDFSGKLLPLNGFCFLGEKAERDEG